MSFRNVLTTGTTEEEAVKELHVRISDSVDRLNLWLNSEIETWERDGTWYAACRLSPMRHSQGLDKSLDIVYNGSELTNQVTTEGGPSDTGTDQNSAG